MPVLSARSGSTRRLRWLIGVIVAAAVTLAAGGRARAHSYGAPSSIFRDTRPPSCNGCHRGGLAPEVTLAASARQLAAPAPVVLTVTVTTPNGRAGAAGFDLRASRPGQFSLGGPSPEATLIARGANGWSEATHKTPKAPPVPGQVVSFSVIWTPAAGVRGTITFTAWGNAVDGNVGNDGPRGDRAARATTDLVIAAAVRRRKEP